MNALVKVLEKIQIYIGSAALLIFFFAIILQIITRYLGLSVTWTEEVSNYSFMWAIFMGAAVMVNQREHFSFDSLLNNLSAQKRVHLTRFIDILLIVFNGFITYYGFLILNHFWGYRWETIPEMNMGYVWIVIPIMSISMMIYSINHLLNPNYEQAESDTKGGI